MRYASLILLFTIVTISAWTQEFEVRSFTVDRTDLAARRYEKRTVNDEPCAIVKINTNIKGMQFDSNLGIVDVSHRDDGYWLYVQPREKRIKLMAANYISQDVNLPEPAAASTVYNLVVVAKGLVQQSELVRVIFRLNQENVYIRLAEQAPVLATGSNAVFNVPKGKHRFRFIKDQFEEQLVELEVNEEVVRDIVLMPGRSTSKLALSGYIIVTSEPSGAMVYLNEQQVGATPYQGRNIAGNYQLRLQHPFHYDHTEVFTLKEGETNNLPIVKLKPRFGYYQITSTPSGAEVWIDGKMEGKTPLTKKQIGSGHHTLSLRYPGYHEQNESFEIKDGDNKNFEIKLKEAFGILSITSDPADARIFIDGKELGTTPYANNNYPSGNYQLRVSKEMHLDVTENVTVKDNEKTERFLVLPKNFGTLQVTATGASIYIDNLLVGSDFYTTTLAPGRHTVKASRDKYRDDEREVFIANGQREILTLSPVPMIGAVSISSRPFETTGADIYINGIKRIEKTPATFPLASGNYEIAVEKLGFRKAQQKVEVADGLEKEIIFELQASDNRPTEQVKKYKTAKIVFGELTAAALAGGIYFRYSTLQLSEQYKTATTDATAIYKKMEQHNLYTTMSFAIAAPLGILTIVKMIQQHSAQKKIKLAVLPTSDGMNFYVSCNF